MCNGISPDGWTGPADSGYFRFSGPKVGHMVITVSRADWGGAPVPSPVHVLIGTLGMDANRQPVLEHVQIQRNGTIDRLQTKTFVVPTPGARFAARVIVDNKFIPHQLDPGNSDTRALGAVVTYRFVPGPVPHAAQR
jgi:hypothetical protein